MVSNIKYNDILAGLITVTLFNVMYIHANSSSVSENVDDDEEKGGLGWSKRSDVVGKSPPANIGHYIQW